MKFYVVYSPYLQTYKVKTIVEIDEEVTYGPDTKQNCEFWLEDFLKSFRK